jgi:release factor glutamine methyltransferase
MNTVKAALAAAREKLPASEARLLLGHVLDRPAAWLIAHDDEVLEEADLLRFASLVARRKGGEPVAYLVGYREFYGREFAVSPAVLIPRPETEMLVELALARKVGAGTTAQCAQRATRILDLGTGSGCIAITLALEIRRRKSRAVDAPQRRRCRQRGKTRNGSVRRCAWCKATGSTN